MNWKAVKQRTVEWSVIALLGFIAGAYAELHRLELDVARHDVYIDMLWKQK